jgi:hypothetical protein
VPAPPIPTVTNQRVGELERKDYSVYKLSLSPEAGLSVPVLCFETNPGINRHKAVFYAYESGKAIAAAPGGALEQVVNPSTTVIALDVRGSGESAPESPNPRGQAHFGIDGKEAFLSLHLSRPLHGQRVLDLLSTLSGLCEMRVLSDLDPKQVTEFVGVGTMGPVALHATALDIRIKSLTLENSLLSWSAVVRSPISVNQLTNVVPGVLAYYDLPDLAALIAPRPLTIKNPVDAMGKPVSQAELERVYAKAIEAYKKAGAEGKLVLIGRK